MRVAFTLRKSGGRKLVFAPDGTTLAPSHARIDSTMLKAIGRAHPWKRLLEGGQHLSIAELAAAGKINLSYVCRVLRLTLLALDIVETILDRRQPPQLKMDMLPQPLPVEWARQRRHLKLMNSRPYDH